MVQQESRLTVSYTHLGISDQRGAERDFARISPGDIRTAGRSKRFCQDKPRRYRTSGAQQEILSG